MMTYFWNKPLRQSLSKQGSTLHLQLESREGMVDSGLELE